MMDIDGLPGVQGRLCFAMLRGSHSQRLRRASWWLRLAIAPCFPAIAPCFLAIAPCFPAIAPRFWAVAPGDCAMLPSDCAMLPGECAMLPSDCARLPGDCAMLPGDCAQITTECKPDLFLRKSGLAITSSILVSAVALPGQASKALSGNIVRVPGELLKRF